MADESITVIGIEKLRRKFTKVGKGLVDYEVLNQLGNYLATAIKYRTLAGKEISGRPFLPYTEKYRLFRIRSGRSGTPNLEFTGSMLGSLTYVPSVSREEVKVFFMEGGRQGVSNPAKAFYLQKKRPFFGASSEDIDELLEIYKDYVKGLLSG